MQHDWARRYTECNTPWDLGTAHPELTRRLAARELAPTGAGRAFVPGCGRAYDAVAIAESGWQVTAVDLVPSLIASPSGRRLSELASRFVCADALALEVEDTFDLLWEHTFFCAIHPDQRASYGRMARRLVAPGGRLCALVFPIGRPVDQAGPPWPVSVRQLGAALGAEFELLSSEPAVNPVPDRSWDEHWAVFEKR